MLTLRPSGDLQALPQQVEAQGHIRLASALTGKVRRVVGGGGWMCGDVRPIVGGVVAEPVRLRRLTDQEG